MVDAPLSSTMAQTKKLRTIKNVEWDAFDAAEIRLDCGEFDEAHDVGEQLAISRCDAAEVFEFNEEALDTIAACRAEPSLA